MLSILIFQFYLLAFGFCFFAIFGCVRWNCHRNLRTSFRVYARPVGEHKTQWKFCFLAGSVVVIFLKKLIFFFLVGVLITIPGVSFELFVRLYLPFVHTPQRRYRSDPRTLVNERSLFTSEEKKLDFRKTNIRRIVLVPHIWH